MNRPWIADLVRTLNAVKLSRDEFVAKYFPKYVKPWKPNYRIQVKPNGRCVRMPIPGDYKSQETKRTNKINEAYESYLASFEYSQPTSDNP